MGSLKELLKYILAIAIIVLINSCVDTQDAALDRDPTIRDADGNIYTAIGISNQEWLLTNLRTTHYNNGDLILTTDDSLIADYDSTQKYQWIYKNMGDSVKVYGRLYTWYAATDKRGVCPVGWHVPSMTEWKTLYDPYDHNSTGYYGAELMEEGLVHWKTKFINIQFTDTGMTTDTLIATNSTGFTAIPAGHRDYGAFSGIGSDTRFWISDELSLIGFGETPMSIIAPKTKGYSIRCLKDSI
jgi:uncharacterized protein (TIGR02145 family)